MIISSGDLDSVGSLFIKHKPIAEQIPSARRIDNGRICRYFNKREFTIKGEQDV